MVRAALNKSPSLVLLEQSLTIPMVLDEGVTQADNIACLKRRLRQAELLSHEAVADAREIIQNVIDTIIRTRNGVSDGDLRHHLMVMADEIALLAKSLDILFQDQETPCFARALLSEAARTMNRFPARFNPNIKLPGRMSFVPSKSAEAIFSRVLRDLLHAAAQCETRIKLINVGLEQHGDMVVLYLDNIVVLEEQEFLLHTNYPRRIEMLLRALQARLDCSCRGLVAYIPVEVCV